MGIVIGIDVGGSTTKIVGINKGADTVTDVYYGDRSGYVFVWSVRQIHL